VCSSDLRHHIDTLPEDAQGWLSGLRDERIGRVLALIHADPEADWTLETLAKSSGMSRSTLAERFLTFTGETPLRYLARWRMQIASRLLQSSGVSMGQIAEQVGYSSEAAFKRAFKKLVGETPGSWRRSRANVTAS